MSTLGGVTESIALLLTIYITTTIFKCAGNKNVQGGGRHRKTLKHTDKKRGGGGENMNKVVSTKESFKQQPEKVDLQKVGSSNGFNNPNLRNGTPYNEVKEKVPTNLSKRNKVHQLEGPFTPICESKRKDISLEGQTITVHKFNEVDCNSLLENNNKVKKKSSIREGEGAYKSLPLTPLPLDSPLQVPSFPELNCTGEETIKKKQNNSSRKKVLISDKQKKAESIKIQKTQCVSVIEDKKSKTNFSLLDDILKGNLFEEVKKSDEEKDESSKSKLEETQSSLKSFV
uniref:Uncharacterized protein n=1 Tax=Strongyloides stercoralis TaxID=6248 RepID=A0A0K0E4R1_STRER